MIMVVAACFRDSHVVAYLAVCSARANIQFFFQFRVFMLGWQGWLY